MNGSILCVGADVHQDQIQLRLLDHTDGHELGSLITLTNNRPGADRAIATLVQVMTQYGYTQLELAMEATALLWLPFYSYLQQSPALAPFHPQILCFNPKLVAKFKEGVSLSPDKDDPRDALAVAERLHFGRLPVSYVPTAEWQALRRLTRYRFRLTHVLIREKVRLQAQLFLKVSDWERVKPFSNALGATSASLLSQFTRTELAALSLDQLTAFIERAGRKHFEDPGETARKVQRALDSSYPVAPELDTALTFEATLALDHLHMVEKLLHRLDREIAQQIEPLPNPLLTLKGLGPVISAGILAEIADIRRFADQPQLAQFAGLVWHKHASGQFVAEETRLTKVGNVYLRYYLIEGANLLRQHNLEYKAYYWRKYQEVPKHQHLRALVLTARKLVRLVYALLTTNQPYVSRQPNSETSEVEAA